MKQNERIFLYGMAHLFRGNMKRYVDVSMSLLGRDGFCKQSAIFNYCDDMDVSDVIYIAQLSLKLHERVDSFSNKNKLVEWSAALFRLIGWMESVKYFARETRVI